jgi:tungstate transport system ATP-binding protein
VTIAELCGVRVELGGRTVLDTTDLAVQEGEVLALLGPTGAGKSTLLQVMGLLLTPSVGCLHWREQPIPHPTPLALRRRIAMAFQEPLLFSGTVFENVAFGLEVRGHHRPVLQRQVEDILRALRIDHLAEQRANTLSGGEAQRTALARALVVRPELLLLDEPLAALDEPIRDELRNELLQIIREHRLTCVFVTHDQDEALAVADRIAVIDCGSLLQVGSPAAVFQQPRTLAVARFVQTTNVLAGRVVSREPGLAVVELAGQRLAARSELPVGAAIHLCVRPDAIELTGGTLAASSRPGENLMPGRIARLTPRGSTLRVEVDCGARFIATLPRWAAAGENLSPGDPVTLRLRPEAIHLIAAAEGTTDADV